MIFAFFAAGIGNALRTKLIKHHFTLFLNVALSVSTACLIYACLLKAAELIFHISVLHEAGYICSMLFIIPGFPIYHQRHRSGKTGSAIRTGTAHLLRHYCSGCNNVRLDHGTDSEAAAGGFSLHPS